MAATLSSTHELYARARARVPVKVRLVGGLLPQRSPLVVTALVGLTGGLYGLVWLALLSRDLKRTTQNADLRPGLDLLLMLLTGGLWGFVVLHRSARYIHAVSMYFERSHDDRSREVLLYSLGSLVSFGLLGLAAVFTVQEQANELSVLAERRSAERARRGERSSDRFELPEP
ncbi:MAG TPA: DUF4234 domain-containing protein [Polyangiaceae bacterium]|nr:DUF4234 domain-containing protein [Polyangiaceae bacterium]